MDVYLFYFMHSLALHIVFLIQELTVIEKW